MTTLEKLSKYLSEIHGHSRSRQLLIEAKAEIERLEKENAKLKESLEMICRFPVHSEPMGGAMAMQDIAQEALK